MKLSTHEINGSSSSKFDCRLHICTIDVAISALLTFCSMSQNQKSNKSLWVTLRILFSLPASTSALTTQYAIPVHVSRRCVDVIMKT